MAKTLSDHLLNSLEELVPYDFEKFKFKLQNSSLEKEYSRIPRGLLLMARPVKLASLLINHYGERDAVQLTLQVLRGINQRLLAEELHKAIGQDCPVQESGSDSSAVSGSSVENKPKSLKISDGLECDRQQQPSGEGRAGLQSGQPDAGRGPQKKSQDRWKDQSLEWQGKPGARSMTPPSRKGPSLPSARLAGEKGCISTSRMRRNANSTGRLQGLSSNSFCGTLGKREFKTAEKKKRPKSLELTIFSEERNPLTPETLLTLEEMKIVSPDPGANLGKTDAANVEATVPPEGGSQNPEQSMTQEGGTSRNALISVHLTGRVKSQDGPESTTLLEENGIRRPEVPGTLHETSNSKEPQNQGHLAALDTVAHKGRPCEGDLVAGTCVHGSRSFSGVPGTSDGHSASCQTLLPHKQQRQSVSPEPPPQCERHMKQPCLLFCEEHRELVCLICSLSQEHRGHQVRPIEEVALEYQDHINWQLEKLKELRKSGEKQKCQGKKETDKFLKQTEDQKEKVRCQMQQLYRFLEKQEQHLVAWLEELGQMVSQVLVQYNGRVSQDFALLDELISELEAKQCQPPWGLVQDIGVILQRANTMTVLELWATPPEVKEKLHFFYHKSEAMEKSMKNILESLRSEMEAFTVQELKAAQAYAVDVILDAETAHPNLIFSDDLKRVKLGNKWDQRPEGPERFNSCIMALGSPTFFSGRHYWEVEVGDKTGWILGVCKAAMSRKGSVVLSPENGYWVVMRTTRNDYRASAFPPINLLLKEPPRRVGIFLDYEAGDISFYNVITKSHIYTFTCCSSSGPLQPVFSPGTHDGGKNIDPLIIRQVCAQGCH